MRLEKLTFSIHINSEWIYLNEDQSMSGLKMQWLCGTRLILEKRKLKMYIGSWLKELLKVLLAF